MRKAAERFYCLYYLSLVSNVRVSLDSRFHSSFTESFETLRVFLFAAWPFPSTFRWTVRWNCFKRSRVNWRAHLITVSLQELKKWMDDSKDGFVYCSFGSMIMLETFPQKILQVFYSSLRKIAPVRVLMKISKPENLPAGLPENIRTSAWLPQFKILSESHYSWHDRLYNVLIKENEIMM